MKHIKSLLLTQIQDNREIKIILKVLMLCSAVVLLKSVFFGV